MTARQALGDVAPLVRRPVVVTVGQSYTEIGVRAYGRGLFVKPAVTGRELGNKRVFRVATGDLVVSNVFAWEGAIAVARPEHDGLIGSHRFMTMTPSDAVSAGFLQHYLLTDEGLAQVRAASPGSAGRNRTLSLRGLAALKVPVPPMADQLRIVRTLSAAETLVQRLAASLNTNGSRDLTASLPGLLGSRLAGLGLPPVRAGDLFDVINDLVHPGDDPGRASSFVGLQHIEPHTGRLLGAAALGDETGRKFRFAPGDVLYGYLRPYLNKVWVADRHGLCSVEQFVLRPREAVDADQLATCLRSSLVLGEAVEATNNLQLPRLRVTKLQSLEVPDIRKAELVLADTDELRERVCRLADARTEQAVLLRRVLPCLREELYAAYAQPR
jgi:type I restriction enzyme S subunit